jgi:PIN domain nuclease of toxin-antitoxin system
MSVVVDAYAIVAALVGERAREAIEPHLATAAIAAINVGEVLDVCVRVHGNAEPAVRERVEWLVAGGLEIVDLDRALAVAAGSLRARRYHRTSCAVSLADCVAAALAHARGLPLATADPDLARAAWAEGIEVHPLPDSRGRRPRR